ncbi:MAG: putative Ig domain-containing protein, partial [Leptospiraceae bacterium]|nr:putative Ig domain-containing protein [Leptospiraceae bacterium]
MNAVYEETAMINYTSTSKRSLQNQERAGLPSWQRIGQSGRRIAFAAIMSTLVMGLTNSCLLLDQLTADENSEDTSFLVALLGGGGGTDTGNAPTGNEAAPTVQFPAASYSFPKNVAIASLTPTLTAEPLTNCTVAPTLPTGLAINSSNCQISGTPTTAQSAISYNITASNATGAGTTTISIEITASGTAPTLSYAGSPYAFSQNVAITTIVPTIGGTTPTSCSASPALPSGLVIDATSCAISGTP